MPARADTVHQRLERKMTVPTDIHTHYATFLFTLTTLADMGRAPLHNAERLFICALPTEWRTYACGHFMGAVGVSAYDTLATIAAALSRWRGVAGTGATTMAAHAVSDDDDDMEARAQPSTYGMVWYGMVWCHSYPQSVCSVKSTYSDPAGLRLYPAATAAAPRICL
jgi:hypothetical protein